MECAVVEHFLEIRAGPVSHLYSVFSGMLESCLASFLRLKKISDLQASMQTIANVNRTLDGSLRLSSLTWWAKRHREGWRLKIHG